MPMHYRRRNVRVHHPYKREAGAPKKFSFAYPISVVGAVLMVVVVLLYLALHIPPIKEWAGDRFALIVHPT